MLIAIRSAVQLPLAQRMQLRLESRTISQAIQTCMDLLEGFRIVVVMGDRLALTGICLLYTSPSPRDAHESRMPSSA